MGRIAKFSGATIGALTGVSIVADSSSVLLGFIALITGGFLGAWLFNLMAESRKNEYKEESGIKSINEIAEAIDKNVQDTQEKIKKIKSKSTRMNVTVKEMKGSKNLKITCPNCETDFNYDAEIDDKGANFMTACPECGISIQGTTKNIIKGLHICEYCSKEFTSKNTTENHEEKCEKRPKFSNFQLINKYEGDTDDFWDKFFHKSLICMIAGARGSGKTALAFRLAENLEAKKKREVFLVGFPDEEVPSWIDRAVVIDQCPNSAVVIYDEASITYDQFSSQKNATKKLADLLKIARHKDLSLIFITQNTSNLNLNIVKMADTLFLLKDSLLQRHTDRGFIKDIYEKIRKSKHPFDLKKQGEVYILDSNFEGMMKFSLASFWSENLSKSYRNKR